MQILIGFGAVMLGYIIGSIPFGLLVVKVETGKDIREVESGRTGGTNAVRAGGKNSSNERSWVSEEQVYGEQDGNTKFKWTHKNSFV